MVRDGYYYAIPLLASAALLAWLAGIVWSGPPVLLAALLLWFFRDPERTIPDMPGAVVSPADGRVTRISPVTLGTNRYLRVSIFLSVFDVHVNRSPISGVIRDVRYRSGKFLNAMNESCAELNEQNEVTVEGDGRSLIFKQIAGLLARRIVFNKKIGDTVARGERVGLIKFGSRTDILLDVSASLQIREGDRVKGGSTVLALLSATSLQSSSIAVGVEGAV